jgi:hypothetical protein
LCVVGIEYGSLGSMAAPDVCGGGERIAGVLAQCIPDSDSLNSSDSHACVFPSRIGLFAMESEDAFALFQQVSEGADLLATYTELGSELVAQAARALAGGAVGTQSGTASLEENSVISILVGTHAPSDTVIVTLRLELSSRRGEASTPGFVYLLVEPKLFGATLAVITDSAQ